MANLSNQQINRTFDGLLQVPGGITSVLQTVQDGNGNPTGLQLSSAGASVTTSSTFVPSVGGVQITGAVARLISDGFGDYVSVKDFGAVGDGVANDTAAFTAMVNHCSTTGAAGYFPAGTYLIDPSTRTFVGSKPFILFGDGQGATILKNSNTASRFIYWTKADGVVFDKMTVDGSFVGLPSVPTSGGTLVLVNSNNNVISNVTFTNIWRVAVLVYNDHQTTLTNVYSGLLIDNIKVLGPDNYIDDVGPSAVIAADINNSIIKNSYAENIGQYGFEFKNDCNNNVIDACVTIQAYRSFYLGGDGTHAELFYVKNTIINNCIAVDGVEPFVIGLGENNIISSCESRTTDSGPTFNRSAISIGSSVNCSVSNLLVVNRKYYACDIREISSGNSVEIALADGSYKGEAIAIASDSTNNKAFITWKNHDTVVLNRLRFPTQNGVADIKNGYFYNYSTATNPKIENALTYDRPPYASTVKGRVQYGNTFDVYTSTNQTSLYENFGNYTTATLSQIRHRFDNGAKVETIWAPGGATSASYTKDQSAFWPGVDNTLNLGLAGNRWGTVYAATGTINTSDAREKQQVKELSVAEKNVAKKLKSLVKTFKFNDAVIIKGDKARIHFGVIAQDVKDAFFSESLNADNYALFCYDSWNEQNEELDNDGNVVVKYKPAGERYGIRYDELLAFIIAAL